MTNRYAGPCGRCGAKVQVGAGEWTQEQGTVHASENECTKTTKTYQRFVSMRAHQEFLADLDAIWAPIGRRSNVVWDRENITQHYVTKGGHSVVTGGGTKRMGDGLATTVVRIDGTEHRTHPFPYEPAVEGTCHRDAKARTQAIVDLIRKITGV